MRKPAAILALLALSACSPAALKGINTAKLDDNISRSIGDPNTCVLVAEAGSGKIVHQYNTHAACRADWPSCEAAAPRSARDLIKIVAKDSQTRTLSCDTRADGSRGVAWATGPVAGRPLVYVAVMEGDRVFPGRMIAERMEGVFQRSGF